MENHDGESVIHIFSQSVIWDLNVDYGMYMYSEFFLSSC